MYLGVERREPIKLEPTKSNIKYASNLRAEILRKIEDQTFHYADYFPNSKYAKLTKRTMPTFGEAATSWLAIQKAEKQLSAWDTYRKYLNKHWLPYFEHRALDSITTSDIKELLAEMDVANKTKNNMLIPLRGVFDDAYYDEVIDRNPTDRIKNLKFQKPEPDPFDLDQVERILAYMADNYDEQVFNYFEFAFFSGLRPPNEMVALQWPDIEQVQQGEQKGRLLATVRRAKVLGQIKEIKTYQSRTVELNDRAAAALARQRKYTYMKSDTIFLNPVTGNPWNDGKAQSELYYHPTLKALKIKDRDPYQTRHTFATMMVMAGANPMWVAQQMGHKNMQMLLTVYAKWIALADKSAEVDKINGAISRTKFAQLKSV